MKKLILFLLLSNAAFADRQTGEIQGYSPSSNGSNEVLVFKLVNNVSAGCNTTGRFAIDSTSPRYKTTLSAIIATFHAKTTIEVDYSPTCNVLGNSADVNFICVGTINC